LADAIVDDEDAIDRLLVFATCMSLGELAVFSKRQLQLGIAACGHFHAYLPAEKDSENAQAYPERPGCRLDVRVVPHQPDHHGYNESRPEAAATFGEMNERVADI
jgi:hypothetical protein